MEKKAYLVIDIGTGNVRVAIVDQQGKVLNIERDIVHYIKDERYPDALYFDPEALWMQIITLAKQVLHGVKDVRILAVTASSQREGIVLLDKSGKSLIGLPNHDHRGRQWEDMVSDPGHVYTLTGRYPTSLFSALKLIGIKKQRKDIFASVSAMLSISDWAQYQLSGKTGYEHAQASETLLYDVARMEWSEELCTVFNIDSNILPPLHDAGTVLGPVLSQYANTLRLSPETVVVVGGADTQLAIKSTQPSVGDIVIVSGTTTPVVKIVHEYTTDTRQRTWTNRHTDKNSFILEANAGVTGLNYQRLKEIFYPNEGYEVIEKELAAVSQPYCIASLGSLIAEEKQPITTGGFIFSTPVSHELSRSSFVRATLWDIACCIKENLESLCDVAPCPKDFVWACGGGFQSGLLRQFIADLTGKKVQLRKGYAQASVVGAALVCKEALGEEAMAENVNEVVHPQVNSQYDRLYDEWKAVRSRFQQQVAREVSA